MNTCDYYCSNPGNRSMSKVSPKYISGLGWTRETDFQCSQEVRWKTTGLLHTFPLHLSALAIVLIDDLWTCPPEPPYALCPPHGHGSQGPGSPSPAWLASFCLIRQHIMQTKGRWLMIFRVHLQPRSTNIHWWMRLSTFFGIWLLPLGTWRCWIRLAL